MSPDQLKHNSLGGAGVLTSRMPLNGYTRFYCTCGFEWIADTKTTLAHGRFLDRARLR